MSTLVGIVLGGVLIVLAVALGGGWRMFLDLESAMIVVGGTLAATLVSFPFHRVLNFFTLILRILREQKSDQAERTIAKLVALGHKAYQDSVYSLEQAAKSEGNRYVRMGLTLLVRDAPAARIARRFAVEMDGVRARHREGVQLFSFMARIAPSFGLVGTLIGLINMLRGVGKEVTPEVLGPSMAVALITTLYGALMAFFLFLPASEKLKAYSEQELGQIMMVRDAMLMMKDGESSRELEEMLNAYLPEKRRRSFVSELLRRGAGSGSA
ncbi:MAG: motility protein A [Thermodesulfobacteriota bacterium]